jgi:stage II sporulation protein D
MKKTIVCAWFGLLLCVLLQLLPVPAPAEPAVTPPPAAAEAAVCAAPGTLRVLLPDGEIENMALEDYVRGVLAAEMPADFPIEALKAQAVAARTYALYCAEGHKHGGADVCTRFSCCQDWQDEQTQREKWGAEYERCADRLRRAAAETAGQILTWEGKPVFAAFHSSSAGATEDCGEVWNPRPYLVSVSSPETAETVPGFFSGLRCGALDFRDTVLSACPEADFSGPAEGWVGELRRDASGRVASLVIGGTEIRGTALRSLFSLRSTAFTLDYADGEFVFTVAGFGHGVGMSQYGAQTMAEQGADYTAILAHYYRGTVLTALCPEDTQARNGP